MNPESFSEHTDLLDTAPSHADSPPGTEERNNESERAEGAGINEETHEEERSPEDTLNYIVKLGEDVAFNAKLVLTMLVEAQEKGVELDWKSSKTLPLFESPHGELQRQLISMVGHLNDLKVELLDQGIWMTEEQVKRRLAEMNEPSSK